LDFHKDYYNIFSEYDTVVKSVLAAYYIIFVITCTVGLIWLLSALLLVCFDANLAILDEPIAAYMQSG